MAIGNLARTKDNRTLIMTQGGLDPIITLFKEAKSPGVRRAAAFALAWIATEVRGEGQGCTGDAQARGRRVSWGVHGRA